ncbi:MAG: queuosine precursor transporter [Acidobacteriota bacterium]
MTAPPSDEPTRQFKYLDFITAAFVTVLLCSNLIGPAKTGVIGGVTFGAGVLFFPISYIFGDILTEVYGYARSRRVIWAGFGALIFATFMTQVVLRLPPEQSDFNTQLQPALELVFGGTWRIVGASLLAFWLGEFMNSYVMARMKVAMEGRRLWARTIGSTVVGQGVDSLVFYPLAFAGIWSGASLIKVMLWQFALKVLWEAVNTPLTYAAVRALKRAEGVDHYDRDTDFTPFSMAN